MAETLFPLPDKETRTERPGQGKPRLEQAERQQVAMRYASLDELLPVDHRVRLIWDIVQEYDLSEFYADIEAIEGEAGRPAIDPRLLVAVWLYATVEGVGSARELERMCKAHLAYQWLLGGVSINYHTLADFRAKQGEKLDHLLTHSVAALMREGLVGLERTAQDGVRIRASAGASSYRRAQTLAECLQQAEQHVQQLKAEAMREADGGDTKRKQAARERHAKERVERIKQAMQETEKIEAKKGKNRELKRKNRPARASMSDPQARVMKMPDGGFRPAYNGQLNVDMESRIIVGVELSAEADAHLVEPMLEQTEERYEQLMEEHYVDGGFRSNANVTAVKQKGVRLYSPIPVRYNKNSEKRPAEILKSDSPEVAEWKQRMSTQEAKEKYKGRAATVEWANALLRNRGLYRFLVRGVKKARAVLLWFVLAHNLMQTLNLRRAAQFAGN